MTDQPLIRPHHSLRGAMRVIERHGQGVALVVDGERRLVGIISDGDLRRAVLAGADLDQPASSLLPPTGYPLMAPVGTDSATLAAMMRERGVGQIPLLDAAGRVAGLATARDLLLESAAAVQAVIMAGGLGTRLRPLTDTCPKPMLPVGGRPLLEHTIERLRAAGIRRVHLTVRHLAEQIIEHFGNGDGFGVEVAYVQEDEPLGTAGALGMVEADGPVLVLNGDVLSGVDYGAMLAYHRDQGADLTVAVRRGEWEVPYGVVEAEGGRVLDLIEKPTAVLWVNAGVYLIESYVQRWIPPQPASMPDVVGALLRMGRPVAAFPLTEGEGWIDVGSQEDYARAQEVVGNG